MDTTLVKINVVMPQMGESIAEGTIVRWLKAIGDRVDRDEPLFEISTDKVDAEIPSPTEGVLVAIHVPEGGVAAVHSVVAVIEGVGPAVPASESVGVTAEKAGASGSGKVQPLPDGTRVSPLARRIATINKINLVDIVGTGISGRIVKQDILQYVEQISGDGSLATSVGVYDNVVQMTVMRKKIAEHMVESRRTSAHVHSVFEVNCSNIEKFRAANKAKYEAANAKLSVLPFVVMAVALTLKKMPLLNASLDGDNIIHHDDIHVGVAVALDSGLIVPVIRNADRLSLFDISLAIVDLAQRARNKKLKPDEVVGGTFTVTNPGNFGGSFATPIINQPQVGILELGSVEQRVIVIEDTIAIKPMMNLTLGFDHRLIDGVEADQFMAAVKKTLEIWNDVNIE